MSQEIRAKKEEKKIHEQVYGDIHGFQDREFYGSVHGPESGKRDGGEHIKSDDQCEPDDIDMLTGIPDPGGYRSGESDGEDQEENGGNDKREKGGTEGFVFTGLLLGVPEKSCFHSIRQDDQQQRGVRIEHVDDAIFFRQE